MPPGLRFKASRNFLVKRSPGHDSRNNLSGGECDFSSAWGLKDIECYLGVSAGTEPGFQCRIPISNI